jgi:uncharacterized membrane protein HdeD (DUF308 family)
MKKTGSKFLYLVVGIILIVAGGYLVYLEFSGHNGSHYHRKWQKYPFIILGIGIISASMAFFNEEKPKAANANSSSGQKTGP